MDKQEDMQNHNGIERTRENTALISKFVYSEGEIFHVNTDIQRNREILGVRTNVLMC